jgi:hypothetical protein
LLVMPSWSCRVHLDTNGASSWHHKPMFVAASHHAIFSSHKTCVLFSRHGFCIVLLIMLRQQLAGARFKVHAKVNHVHDNSSFVDERKDHLLRLAQYRPAFVERLRNAKSLRFG